MYKYNQLREKMFCWQCHYSTKVSPTCESAGGLPFGSSHHITGKLHYLLSFYSSYFFHYSLEVARNN